MTEIKEIIKQEHNKCKEKYLLDDDDERNSLDCFCSMPL